MYCHQIKGVWKWPYESRIPIHTGTPLHGQLLWYYLLLMAIFLLVCLVFFSFLASPSLLLLYRYLGIIIIIIIIIIIRAIPLAAILLLQYHPFLHSLANCPILVPSRFFDGLPGREFVSSDLIIPWRHACMYVTGHGTGSMLLNTIAINSSHEATSPWELLLWTRTRVCMLYTCTYTCNTRGHVHR